MPSLSIRDVVLFVLLVGLLGALWWREQRRAAAGGTHLSAAARALLLLAAVGGGLGAVIWFALVPGTFAWSLPPLASRFLAAASAGFAVGCALALWRGRWPEARLLLVITAAYFVPLVLTLPLDLERFNFALPVTWGFFLVAAWMLVVAILALAQSPRGPEDGSPAPGLAAWTRGLLGLVGVAALLLGLALLITPGGAAAIWPWRWTLEGGAWDALSIRLLAAMFIGLAAGAAFTLRANRRDVAQVYLAVLAAYAVVAAAGIALSVLSGPGSAGVYAYLAILAVVALAALAGLLRPAAPASREGAMTG